MPLYVPPAPAPALRSVLTALGSPTAVRETRTPALRDPQGPLSPEHPLPMYVLELSDAGAHPRTRLIGWRFLIRDGGRDVATAEAKLTPDGWAFSRFCEGPYVHATERALKQAESLRGAHQPRLLHVPDLYMCALWLHHDTMADGTGGTPEPSDLLVPLAPAPPGIAAHRPHRVEELLPRLTLRLAPVPPPLLGSPA